MSGARATWPRRPAGIAYGGDYNPEQWPEATWLEDVRLMRVAGVNLVTVGVFAWSRLQPRPDAWDFDWLDRILDLLAENEIAVDLATATASPPPWFSLRHPESLPVTDVGTRLEIGSRQHFCPSSPAFREAAGILVERLATRYGSHPAVVLWHVGNEYGDHVQQCFCDVSAADFRAWLRARHGTLVALNVAWATDVWSGHFGDWAEVMPPRAAPGPANPAHRLDWRRFSSDAILGCFENERAILERITPTIPVTTNFMRLNSGIDHWSFAAREDVVACDIYPDPLDPAGLVEAALTHDLMRSLADGRPWLLMEQARSAVDWRPINLPKPPDLLRAQSLEAIARGADGVQFFQWRGARGGAEAFHSTMLPAGGTGTRGWRTTVELGNDLRCLGEVADSRVQADTALLVDWESWWALDGDGHPSDRLRFHEQALAYYRPFHAASVAVDVRRPGHDLAAYRLVVAPNLFLLDEPASANLAGYVRAGGVLVIGPFSGVVDRDHRVPTGHYPGLLRDLLGITWEEVWPLPDGESVGVALDSGMRCRATTWRDALELAGAQAVAWYEDGQLASWPTVTRHKLGAGEAWYIGAVLDARGMDDVLRQARDVARVAPVAAVPAEVRALRRTGPTASYLFLVNHGSIAAAVSSDDAGLDLLSGSRIEKGGLVHLDPLGAAVLRVPRAAPADRVTGSGGT